MSKSKTWCLTETLHGSLQTLDRTRPAHYCIFKEHQWGQAAAKHAGEGLVFSVVRMGVWFSPLPWGRVMSIQATQGEYFLFVS